MKITEVGPRDGLQNEKLPIATEDKFQFIKLLQEAGLKHIEATSFVKPEAVPQLSDSLELSKKLLPENSIEYTCLVPNQNGYEKAIQCGYKKIAIFTSPSDSFNLKNIRKTTKDSLEVSKSLIQTASKDSISVRVYISTVVYCPYSGKISPEAVLNVAEELLSDNVYEISLGETLGMAVPSEIESLLEVLLKRIPANKLAGHYHDTYGMAISNVFQSIKMGLTSFDSSAGGLGGCPYAPGASGNLSTEDLVYLLEKSGYSTGVDLPKLAKATHFIESKLNKSLPSKTYRALLCNSPL